MPTNRIQIEWSESSGFDAKVYDNNGVAHNITSIFQRISGATGVGRVSSKIELGNGTVETGIEFRPTSKELTFNTTPKVVNQILEALP